MILRGRKASPTIIFSVWFCCWSFMVVLGLLWFLHLTERRCAPHLSYVSLSPAIGHVVPLDSLLMLWLTVMFPGILPASHTGTPYSFLVLSILTSIQQRTDPGVPSPPVYFPETRMKTHTVQLKERVKTGALCSFCETYRGLGAVAFGLQIMKG